MLAKAFNEVFSFLLKSQIQIKEMGKTRFHKYPKIFQELLFLNILFYSIHINMKIQTIIKFVIL